MSGISTSTPLCVADGAGFEQLYPTATTGSTFTAVFTKLHAATAIVSAGGLCGYYVNLVDDNVTSATGLYNSNVAGTVRQSWPVIATTSATSMQVWVSAQGQYANYPYTRWSSGGSYAAYPGAEVKSVQVAGALSNTLTLFPNQTAWSNGDTIEIQPHPAVAVSDSHHVLYKNMPGMGGSIGSNGPVYFYEGIWGSTTTNIGNPEGATAHLNLTPPSFYGGAGGHIIPPHGLGFQGPWLSGLEMLNAPSAAQFGAILRAGCPYTTLGCGDVTGVVELYNGSSYDTLNYAPSARSWNFSGLNLGAPQGTFPLISNGSNTTPLALLHTDLSPSQYAFDGSKPGWLMTFGATQLFKIYGGASNDMYLDAPYSGGAAGASPSGLVGTQRFQ
jgi:hypothetical protein